MVPPIKLIYFNRATVGFNLLTVVALISPAIPPVLRSTSSAPNVALQNAMACRVYRLLKLGEPDDDISLVPNSRTPRSAMRFASGTENTDAIVDSGVHTKRDTGQIFTLSSLDSGKRTRPYAIDMKPGEGSDLNPATHRIEGEEIMLSNRLGNENRIV